MSSRKTVYGCSIWTFSIGSGILFTASLLVFILGYAVPKARYDGYNLSLCTCLSTSVSSGPPYIGTANLQYGQIIKNIIVVNSRSLSVVNSFLNANYKDNSQVPCYQNGSDIQVSIFTNVIAIIFGTVTLILAICLLMIFVVLTIRHRRRSNYVDLDVVDLPPSPV